MGPTRRRGQYRDRDSSISRASAAIEIFRNERKIEKISQFKEQPQASPHSGKSLIISGKIFINSKKKKKLKYPTNISGMFKVSQEMRLNTQAVAPASNPSGSGIDGNSPEEGGIFGRYQRTPDAGEMRK